MAGETLLTAAGVRWSPPGGPEVLTDVDLTLEPGQALWLSGPSGGGKSTLLRLLNRLISPDGGEIAFLGRPLADWPLPGLRRQVVLAPQTPVLTARTVGENLRLPFSLRVASGAAAPDDAALEAACARLGLTGVLLAAEAAKLSVGQKQRLCLLRALLVEPRVLLLDEPLAPLDPDSVGLALGELARFQRGGGALVLVSHQAPALACRHLELAGGRLREAP